MSDRVPVLDLEPELGELIGRDDLDRARAAALVMLHDLPPGPWEPTPESAPAGGFLVVHGCLSRDVAVLGGGIAVDFVGQGDLFHTSLEPVMTSVPAESSWSVLEPTRIALLDEEFLAAVQPWPQLTASLLRRQERRSGWLAHILAIGHLPRVEARVLVLLWLFADRWGHKTGSVVRVPIPLTHLEIAQLIGARRPTVTTTLNQLIASGRIAHDRQGHWTLYGDPPTMLRP